MTQQTIAAIASAPGTALRGILRISGSQTLDVLRRALRLPVDDFSSTHSRRYRMSLTGDVLTPDAAGASATLATVCEVPADLLLWPTSRSYTGEPLAELHLPGSAPLLNAILTRLLTSGARPAQRGEFTLRAFLAGRIDLVQAEAVLGVIDSTDQAQLQTALSQMAGGISSKILEIREQLLLHLADVEAGLDFVEEDIEFVNRDELQRRLQSAFEIIQRLQTQTGQRMQSAARYQVVLAGLPNAGKSTLFNAIAGRQAAMVSSIPGTTRDYLGLPVETQGTQWLLIDTAGWEDPRDEIEVQAGRLRDDQFQRADLVVWCEAAGMSLEDRHRNRELLEQWERLGKSPFRITTKADLLPADADLDEGITQVQVSAANATGVAALMAEICRRLSTSAASSEMISTTAARCSESLQHASDGIQQALQLAEHHAGDELIAMELREILEHLGRITGRVYTDDILDRIFSRFCIGK